jgi:predicted  nucleic acid-binding Zn-ribbon protein
MIGAFSTIVVAIIQSRTNKKAKASEEFLANINEQIEETNKKVVEKIEKVALNSDKRFLINFMSKVENGVKVSEEETKCAFETKEEYNALGGDSYIDTKWDVLLEQKLLKL